MKEFHPRAPDRLEFEKGQPIRMRFLGPLGAIKTILPNLLPVPFFILGAISTRLLVHSKMEDISGMQFAQDQSSKKKLIAIVRFNDREKKRSLFRTLPRIQQYYGWIVQS